MSDFRAPDVEQKLRGPKPEAPSSVAPEIVMLRRRVTVRRWRKRLAAASLPAIAAATMLIVGPSDSGVAPELARTVGPSRTEPGSLAVTPVDRFDPPFIADAVDGMDDFRVFARVRDQLPVFGVNHETQQMEHVGWVESDCAIPVDLNGLTTDQRQSIRALLDEKPVAQPARLIEL